MIAEFRDRTGSAHECDHMRPVVRVDGVWHHVNAHGAVAGECSASVYLVGVTYSGGHPLTRLVTS